jgi:short-subunit dehydrogenase/dTDP-4-dehydrorhamnose reductase
VGRHVIRELEETSARGNQVIEVTVLVRDQGALPREWKESGSRLRILEHDLTRLSSDVKLGGFDYVFHLAANVDFFANQASAQDNVTGTINLLRAVSGQRLKRFVLASTFGAIDRSPVDDCTRPLDEQSPPHPTSLYGRSKLDSEKAVMESEVPYTIVRLPWCYGPGMAQRHHVRSLFERSLRGSLLLKVDWPGRVSVAEVRDLARLLWRIAVEPKALNETFFVSDGVPISFGSFFRAMGEISGHKAGYLRIPGPVMQICRCLQRFLPFQLRCLLFDALTVSPNKLKAIAEIPSPHSEGFLMPLARYVRQDLFPGRWRTLVLITGAASGIGRAFAEKCYTAGYRLLLVDRNARALEALGTRLEAEVMVADLSREDHVDAVLARLMVAGRCPDILINNAGVGLRNVITELDASALSTLLSVNCAAPMKLMQVFLRECLRRKAGTVINIGSSAAFQPLPYMAAYSASKAFLVNLSEAVSGELEANANSGAVEVITVIPSGTATGFQNAAGVKRKPGEKLLEPTDVVQAVLRQVGRGSRTITIGSSARLMGLAARILPRRLQVRLWQRMMKTLR